MGLDAAQPTAPPQLPAQPQHSKKASMEELFEHRWRKAYEVRALERQANAKSQAAGPSSVGSGQGADRAATSQPAPATSHAAVGVHAAAGAAATAAALGSLSLHGGAMLAATAVQQAQAQQRKGEVADDDDELLSVPAVAASSAHAKDAGCPGPAESTGRQGAVQQGRQQGRQEGEEQPEEELQCRLVWDGSSHRGAGAGAAPAQPAGTSGGAADAALQLKDRGNASLRAGNFEAAVRCYSEALAACAELAAEQGQAGGGEQQPQQVQQPAAACGTSAAGPTAEPAGSRHQHLLAMLHSNRAHALLKLKRNEEAATDALAAHRLHPAWPKPLFRLAQAKLALGHWAAAVAACKAGEQLAPRNSEGHTEFTPLLDRSAVHAARAGSLVGFDGQQLEVRSAGDEAWLGGPAPHVPELDGPEDEDSLTAGPNTTLPALPAASTTAGEGSAAGGLLPAGTAAATGSSSSSSSSDALAAWDYHHTAEARARRRTSFRSIREAVSAARDGDRILLRRGVHNGMGECISLTKRVLIEGEGALGEAVIDQRANCPTFRINRCGVVLRHVDLDQTGFREALLVAGGPSVHPLIQDCRIKCSGDDAVNTSGSAAPTLLRCVVTGKKCGVKAFGSSAPRLEHCSVERCGEQGVRAMEQAALLLHSCTISECAEEAAVAMDEAQLTLQGCMLQSCKGPGVDLSGSARAAISGGRIEGCVGGVWVWDAARADLRGASVAGGPSHALLADGSASLEVRDSTVWGSVHATDAAWRGILHASNTMQDPQGPTDFPPEEVPFCFVPNPYTRKQ